MPRFRTFLFAIAMSASFFCYADDSDDDFYDAPTFAAKGQYTPDIQLDSPELPTSSLREFMPSYVVNGCVNAMTGEYFENGDDLSVPGVEPLVFSRSYQQTESGLSRDNFFSRYTIAAGWNHNFYQTMQFVQNDSHKHHDATLRTASGSLIYYDGRGSMHHDAVSLQLNGKMYKEGGLTNCSSGIIGGRTSLKNSKVVCDRKTPQYAKKCIIKDDDGTKRTMRMCRHSPGGKYYDFEGTYHILNETLPNGNRILYEYNASDNQRMITVTDSSGAVTIAWLAISYYGNDNFSKVVTTSDGRKVDYKTTRMIKNCPDYFLYDVVFDNGSKHHYDYTNLFDRSTKAISRHEKFDGRYINIAYYTVGNNELGKGGSVYINPNHKGDTRLRRVAALREPVGSDEKPIITASFIYNTDRKTYGITSAFDALGVMTQYHYTKRINRIDDYAGKELNGTRTLYRMKKFFWGKGNIVAEGDLIATALTGVDDRAVWSRTFAYDSRHNVVEERLYGNLSGLSEPTFSIDDNGRPVGAVECYATRYTYSNDDFNLITSKRSDNGVVASYRYKPGTNLLVAEFVGTDETPILLRTFYEYDSCACMIRKIVDDGIGNESADISGVTKRSVTVITPHRAVAGFGLPEVVEEYYLDIAAGNLVLISKSVNTFESSGLLCGVDVYDASGCHAYHTTLSYDDMGRLIAESDPLGRVKTLSYDLTGNIIACKGFRPNDDTITTYDLSNRPVHSVKKCGDAAPRSVTTAYDYVGNVVAAADTYGNETFYEYDDFGRLVATTYPSILDGSGETKTPMTRNEYDIAGNIIAATDANGSTIRSSYTVGGKPVTIEYPDGTSENFLYNSDGTLAKKREKNGSTVSYTYDFLGRVTREEHADAAGTSLVTMNKEYSAFALLASIDAENVRTDYRYDDAGRLSTTTQGDVMHKEFLYDALGRLETTKEWYGVGDDDYTAHVEVHDRAGRIVEIRTEDGAGTLLEKTLLFYDDNDNCIETVTSASDGTSSRTATEYNSNNEPVRTTDALGAVTLTSYDHSFVNAIGQRVLQKTTTDAMGNSTVTTMDALGHIATVVKKDHLGTTVAGSEYRYDNAGNKTRSIETVIANGAEKEQHVTVWEYGPLNRLEATWERFGTVAARKTAHNYDAHGKLSSIAKPNGIILSNTYDSLGRLATFEASDGSFSYRYSYDRNSAVVTVADAVTGATTQRSYNAAGQVVAETLANGLTVSRSFDMKGRLTHTSLPDSREVSYRSDAFNIREITYTHGEESYTHSYDTFGIHGIVVASCLIGNSGNALFSHDALGRVTAITTGAFAETIAYNSIGDIIAKKTSAASGMAEKSFSYDALHQLVVEEGAETHRYCYDSINNRLDKDGERYAIGPHNELVSHSNTLYDYDFNGNVIAKHIGAQQISYSYDGLDRLISATEGEHVTVVFSYDAFNRRMDKTLYTWNSDDSSWHLHSHIRFIYDGSNEIGATDTAGAVVELRILGIGRGAEIGAAIAVELDGTAYAPVHDSVGNVVALVDADSGAVTESYRYTAYGEATIYDNTGAKAATSPLANPWRFASKRHDDETGLIFFGKRYYNAETGRWTTPDPRGFADGPNLYAYVHNNPLTLFDLYGEFSIFELLTNLFSDSSVDATNNRVSVGKAVPIGHNNSHAGNGWHTNNANYNAHNYAGFIPKIMREKIAADEIPEYTVVGDVEVPDATIFYHNGINTSHERALE